MTARRHAQRPDGEPVNAGQSAPVAAKAAAIDAAQARPLTWKAVVMRALAVAVAGAALYLVLPKLIAVLGAWPRLSTLNPVWFTVCLAAELVSFTCNFALQRLALRTKDWFPVVTAGLSGNAVTSSLPGGSAAGAAVQFRMLTTAGFDTDTAVGGLTAFSLLEVGGLLALPIFALPAILAGVPVSRGLVHTALLGIAAFVLYAIFGVIVLRTDWPLATLGRVAQSLWNRITRGHRPPVTGLDQRLLAERDMIGAVLGKNWRQAAVLTAGRLGFDYGCLLAALRATGASLQPSLVLLAYAAAGIVALFPLTPGGLGIVEASLSGLLILAGVRRRLRRPGHPGLPDRLLLAPPPLRAAGLPAVPPPLRAAGPPARHAGRGRLHRVARAYATRACVSIAAGGPAGLAGWMLDDSRYGPSPGGGELACAVGGELITCHGARLGKVLVRRGPQRLPGGCQVPDLKAVARRYGGRAASRVGGEDHHAHRRNRPDVAEDARDALVR